MKPRFLLSFFCFLIPTTFMWAQGPITPINNGVLRSNLNANGFKLTNLPNTVLADWHITDAISSTVLTNYVLNTTTVNSHALTGNVTINAADVGAPVGSGSSTGTNTGDQVISDATITTTDITTNNVSTTKHGFAPKLPNDSTKYLNGAGVYTVPPDTNSGGTVTSFSAADLSPLFTTSEATITTTPALTFTLSTAATHTFFGNETGSTAAPHFVQPAFTDISGSAVIGQFPIGTTSSTIATGDRGVTTLSLTTPSVIYTTPVTFTNTGGAWSGTLALINQAANTFFGNGTGSSATPTFMSAGTARTALGLGTLATQSGTFSGTSSGTNTGDQTSVSGNAGTATALATARVIYGNNFDGTAALAQIITSTYGGTGNGFTKFSGPTTSEKTKTMRDATDTILELGGSYTPTGTWTSLTLVAPVLGTPTSGVVTNLTGTASININGTVGATTPAAGTFTTLVVGSTTSLLLGTAGSAVGNIGFRNATSGTMTLAPPTGALSTYTVTLPNAASVLPIYGQQITYTGPSTTRTVTYPDANFTVARTDAANTFIGHQTIEGVTSTGATGTGKQVYDTSPTLVTPALGAATATTINGVTINNNAWITSFTPVVTAGSGTITTSSTTCRYIQLGKTVICFIDALITTNGTGAGAVRVTLPISSATNRYVVSGVEFGVTDKLVGGDTSAGTYARIKFYDGTYPGANGAEFALSVVYEVP